MVDHGHKALQNFVVLQGSRLDEALIKEIEWPRNCLIVGIQRGSDEIIPRGSTKLQTGDVIVAMTNEQDIAAVHDGMEKLCREEF